MEIGEDLREQPAARYSRGQQSLDVLHDEHRGFMHGKNLQVFPVEVQPGIREVDPTTLLLTGLTRDGVYLIEDGEVTAAVNNFRFNESPLDLLRRATEAGVSEKTLPREWGDWVTRAAMPSLRIPDFHMSSVSQAQ